MGASKKKKQVCWPVVWHEFVAICACVHSVLSLIDHGQQPMKSHVIV